MRLFVVISGLPGSGKTTLGRHLAPALGLPLIDKDEILHRLFEHKGTGDETWRRALSREADRIFRSEAEGSLGAVLVSHWRLTGMPPDTGTDASWLTELSPALVQVRCVCPPGISARRFLDRQRHPGHLDGSRSRAEVAASIELLAGLEPLAILPRIEFDTSGPSAIDELLAEIRAALATSGCRAPSSPRQGAPHQ
jgi:hypothetical protein